MIVSGWWFKSVLQRPAAFGVLFCLSLMACVTPCSAELLPPANLSRAEIMRLGKVMYLYMAFFPPVK